MHLTTDSNGGGVFIALCSRWQICGGGFCGPIMYHIIMAIIPNLLRKSFPAEVVMAVVEEVLSPFRGVNGV
ncbi:hypothetical protein CBR_g30243 [Chara braunii]|uniref:Uncharacterized protein n=1 Tax=Chara braunii TaxID=69332 RepID=A0A388LCS0_CHABU|nr:hypothetical protein CBR_g30243 [Chara braunii]|eukprot:GBG79982.1 hypothetical protein CBR_g30243 [Chara braunii]